MAGRISTDEGLSYDTMPPCYSEKQGQYLAVIYYYTKIHGCSPSEETVSQSPKVALSSRTNVRDLKFLAALEMTNRGRRGIFAIATQSRNEEASLLRGYAVKRSSDGPVPGEERTDWAHGRYGPRY